MKYELDGGRRVESLEELEVETFRDEMTVEAEIDERNITKERRFILNFQTVLKVEEAGVLISDARRGGEK